MLSDADRPNSEDKKMMHVYVKKSEHIPWCL